MEGKGSISSSSSALNTTNVSTIQSDFKESSKKKPSCSSGNVTTGGRIKDKKKENHATPMETSDEEAPAIDVIGESRAN